MARVSVPLWVSRVSFLSSLALPLAGQCDFTWEPGPAAPGPYGDVYAALALPGGELIVGGTFTFADQSVVNHIARWNGSSWQPLGAGFSGVASIRCLARLPNGDIVVGGSFASAGTAAASNIARWNGFAWTSLGTGLSGPVYALQVLPNGDLVAGGAFTAAGSVSTSRIARWDGISWTAIGTGFSGGTVYGIGVAANGDIIAGGDLQLSTSAKSLYRWDGTAWSDLPGLASFNFVQGVTTTPNGDVFACGSFLLPLGGTARVVRWDGVALQTIDPPLFGGAAAIVATANGDVVTGTNSGQQPSLARWNGTAWSQLTGGPSVVRSLVEDSSGAIVVGSAAVSSDPTSRSVTRYDGVSWQPVGAPRPPVINAMVRMPNGDVVVGGAFASLAGVNAANVARWHGGSWQPLGLGVDGDVLDLAVAPNGDLVVCGAFAAAGGAPAAGIARWNGQVWTTLGAGPATANTGANKPSLVAIATDGSVFTWIQPQLRRYDGAAWSTVTFPGTLAIAQDLAALPNGDVAIGGIFIGIPGQPTLGGLVVYQQGVVTTLPNTTVQVGSRLLVTSNGDLIVRGQNMIMRWDGATWTTLPFVAALSTAGFGELANGELVTAGSQNGSSAVPSIIYRLRNGAWEPFGGLAGNGRLVASSGTGDLFVASTTTTPQGLSFGLAHATPACAARATVFGSGCVGGAGPVTLLPDNLAWIGGVFRSTATGMTANSLALQAFGVVPTVAALPGGAPGCSLFVTPILVDVVVPAAGVATAEFAVPNQPILIGQTLREQVFGIELSTQGITRLTSSNALDLIVGAL